jgi:hypothetical protein
MKSLLTVFSGLLFIPLLATAEESASEQALATHREGAAKVANHQDELAADVQQLTLEQTSPEVVKLLDEVGKIMDEATDKLADANTGIATIAAQTEVIEKIHAAAKAKNQQSGGNKPSSAMMDMMERMMGKNSEGKGKEPGKDGKAGTEGGEGKKGLSDTANTENRGQVDGTGKPEARRVPKASGIAGRDLPEEFHKALDAYNRGAEKKVK